MYEFQDAGIDWLRHGDRLFLGDEPGLGKTRQLLLASAGTRTLVVAPAMLLGVWADEAEKWNPDADLACWSYGGTCTTKRGPKGGRVPLPVPLPELKHQWETVIFDEAHYLKSHGRNQAAWAGAGMKLAAYGERVWLASGTAIPNWADEIYNAAQLLHPGDSRFTSYWRWAEEWFAIWEPRWGGRKVGKLKKTRTWQEFHDVNLGDRFLMRTWAEIEDQLPPLRQQTIEVEMVPAQKRFYQQLKQQYVADLPNAGEVVAWNSGGLASKLAQAAFGLEMFGDVGSGKLQLAAELLRSWDGHPAIVAVHHRRAAAVAAELCRRIGRKALVATGDNSPHDRYQIAKRFQEGEADILVATIDSIAEGLTLTRANRLLFLEKSWRPSRNTQIERRIWRISQESPCLVVDLVSKESVDVRLRSTLLRKTDQQMRALRPAELARML